MTELITDKDLPFIESCLTLSQDMCEATDFKADEAINIDKSISLPEFYSLGERIYETQNQGKIGSCTAMGTSHSVQILAVKDKGIKPTNNNIITIDRRDLRSKMGHDPYKYDGGDYVEKSVSTALKQGIKTVEKGDEVKFDGYAYGDWNSAEYDKNIDMMKRYLYVGCPIVWCVRGDKKMWTEMTKGEVVSVPASPTGGHCIALVGWDANGFWFINSWSANDDNKRKSRFHVSYANMKKIGPKFNRRYRVLYIKSKAKIDPNRLKKINVYTVVLEVLKKYYGSESAELKNGIVAFSQAVRKDYPELNSKIPL